MVEGLQEQVDEFQRFRFRSHTISPTAFEIDTFPNLGDEEWLSLLRVTEKPCSPHGYCNSEVYPKVPYIP